MMKVTLEYNPDTGELNDQGVFVANIGSNFPFNPASKKESSDAKNLVSLKDAGFTAAEIMQMKRENLI